MRHAGIDELRVAAIPGWAVSNVWTPVERAVLAYTDAVVYDYGRVPDGVFAKLKEYLSDEDILELTYHITGYILHATFCKALRLEFDDVPERVVEVPVPPGKDLGAFATRFGVDKKAAWSPRTRCQGRPTGKGRHDRHTRLELRPERRFRRPG